MEKAYLSAARKTAGLAPGNVFLVHGLPSDFSEQDLEPVLAEAGWRVSVVPYSRRTRGQISVVRVRSETEPPKRLMKVVTAGEIVTLQIRDSTAPEKNARQDEGRAPTTWAEAAKCALGKDRSTTTNPTQFSPHRQSMGSASGKQMGRAAQQTQDANQLKRTWAEQSEEDDEEDLEYLWDLWEQDPPWTERDGEDTAHVDVECDSEVECRTPHKKMKTHNRSRPVPISMKGRRLRNVTVTNDAACTASLWSAATGVRIPDAGADRKDSMAGRSDA